ncbi:hypothetical protein OSTOST_11967 [Ostertagia ostertagi]
MKSHKSALNDSLGLIRSYSDIRTNSPVLDRKAYNHCDIYHPSYRSKSDVAVAQYDGVMASEESVVGDDHRFCDRRRLAWVRRSYPAPFTTGIIVFCIALGISLSQLGAEADVMIQFFAIMDKVIMKLVMTVMCTHLSELCV